jgi:hypothetical protein
MVLSWVKLNSLGFTGGVSVGEFFSIGFLGRHFAVRRVGRRLAARLAGSASW